MKKMEIIDRKRIPISCGREVSGGQTAGREECRREDSFCMSDMGKLLFGVFGVDKPEKSPYNRR